MKNCPFCGEENPMVMELVNPDPPVGMSFDPYVVRCSNCGAQGPVAKWGRGATHPKTAAVELWNQRY